MEFKKIIDRHVVEGKLPKKLGHCLQKFFDSYKEALEENNDNIANHEAILNQFLDLVVAELQHPSKFEAYHQRITTPVDYYQFGLDLIRPLVKFEESQVYHTEQLDKMIGQLAKGENVILLANHQTEPDPQAIALLLEKNYSSLAKSIILIAGNRVISDPLAIPFSKGCNLICIFSKRHIENPPEKKSVKLLHNKKAMHLLGSLLAEGGKIIYVAPSGGRDRPNKQGKVEVSHFDPQSIEMFRLVAKQSQRPCHFYPLALATYSLLPPPSSIETELGEHRHAQCTPLYLSFGKEIDMDNFPGSQCSDKHELRKNRAEHIWKLVVNEYERLGA